MKGKNIKSDSHNIIIGVGTTKLLPYTELTLHYISNKLRIRS